MTKKEREEIFAALHDIFEMSQWILINEMAKSALKSNTNPNRRFNSEYLDLQNRVRAIRVTLTLKSTSICAEKVPGAYDRTQVVEGKSSAVKLCNGISWKEIVGLPLRTKQVPVASKLG